MAIETEGEPQSAPPLRSRHTTTLPILLAERERSVLVTTYQAGKLVILRADDDGRLNTHFRGFRPRRRTRRSARPFR